MNQIPREWLPHTLAPAGIPLAVLEDFLRFASVSITHRRFTHYEYLHLRAAYQLLENEYSLRVHGPN